MLHSAIHVEIAIIISLINGYPIPVVQVILEQIINKVIIIF